MKVKCKAILDSGPGDDDVLDVYSFYTENDRRYYVVSPALCEGLVVLDNTDIDIIDPNFGKEYFKVGAEGEIRHLILKDEKLYEGLLENDPDCYEVFMHKLNGQKNSQNR